MPYAICIRDIFCLLSISICTCRWLQIFRNDSNSAKMHDSYWTLHIHLLYHHCCVTSCVRFADHLSASVCWSGRYFDVACKTWRYLRTCSTVALFQVDILMRHTFSQLLSNVIRREQSAHSTMVSDFRTAWIREERFRRKNNQIGLLQWNLTMEKTSTLLLIYKF